MELTNADRFVLVHSEPYPFCPNLYDIETLCKMDAAIAVEYLVLRDSRITGERANAIVDFVLDRFPKLKQRDTRSNYKKKIRLKDSGITSEDFNEIREHRKAQTERTL